MSCNGPYSFSQLKNLIGNCDNLPVLNLGGRVSDYITWLKPEEMEFPIMKFEDAWGRQGIALRLYSVSTGNKGVFVIFNRCAQKPDFGMTVCDWKLFDELQQYHNDNSEDHLLHLFACVNCPFDDRGGFEKTIKSFFVHSFYFDPIMEELEKNKPFIPELCNIVCEYIGLNPIQLY